VIFTNNKKNVWAKCNYVLTVNTTLAKN